MGGGRGQQGAKQEESLSHSCSATKTTPNERRQSPPAVLVSQHHNALAVQEWVGVGGAHSANSTIATMQFFSCRQLMDALAHFLISTTECVFTFSIATILYAALLLAW